MKSLTLITLVSLGVVSCDNASSNIQNEDSRLSLTERSTADVAYFYSGVCDTITYDSIDNEYDIYIHEDFKYRPYGEIDWISQQGRIRVKVKCRCLGETGGGGCDPSYVVDENDVTVTCNNPCAQGCRMRVKIKSIAPDIVIDEFDGGIEVKLQ